MNEKTNFQQNKTRDSCSEDRLSIVDGRQSVPKTRQSMDRSLRLLNDSYERYLSSLPQKQKEYHSLVMSAHSNHNFPLLRPLAGPMLLAKQQKQLIASHVTPTCSQIPQNTCSQQCVQCLAQIRSELPVENEFSLPVRRRDQSVIVRSDSHHVIPEMIRFPQKHMTSGHFSSLPVSVGVPLSPKPSTNQSSLQGYRLLPSQYVVPPLKSKVTPFLYEAPPRIVPKKTPFDFTATAQTLKSFDWSEGREEISLPLNLKKPEVKGREAEVERRSERNDVLREEMTSSLNEKLFRRKMKRVLSFEEKNENKNDKNDLIVGELIVGERRKKNDINSEMTSLSLDLSEDEVLVIEEHQDNKMAKDEQNEQDNNDNNDNDEGKLIIDEDDNKQGEDKGKLKEKEEKFDEIVKNERNFNYLVTKSEQKFESETDFNERLKRLLNHLLSETRVKHVTQEKTFKPEVFKRPEIRFEVDLNEFSRSLDLIKARDLRRKPIAYLNSRYARNEVSRAIYAGVLTKKSVLDFPQKRKVFETEEKCVKRPKMIERREESGEEVNEWSEVLRELDFCSPLSRRIVGVLPKYQYFTQN